MKEKSTRNLLPYISLLKSGYLVLFLFFAFSIQSNAQVSLYSFTQSQQTYTPLTSPTVLGTATSATADATNLVSVVYTLPAGTVPFNFKFDKTVYTGLFVSSNGFITFGTAPSNTNVSPISSTATYPGSVGAFGRSLAGVFISAGSPSNAEISYSTVGTSPNREFVVQWKNMRSSTTAVMTLPMNFQIRLQETTNRIRVVYNFTSGIANSTAQVGLRGPNNTFPTNVNNRLVVSGTNTWLTSSAGAANNSTCQASGTFIPPSGLAYDWVIACPGPEQLSFVTSTQTTALLKWLGNGGPYELEYGTAGFTPGTGTIVNTPDTFLLLNNLSPSTTYNFYVRANCTAGGNGYSAKAGPAIFKTGGAGEDCATAVLVSVASSYAASTAIVVNTGVSANGPGCLCTDSSGKIAGNDTWLKFVAPAGNQRISFRTTAGTVNDWVMEVWNGCPGSTGSFVIGCNDDSGSVSFMPYVMLCQNVYTAGNTYYVRLWTNNSLLSGNMSIRIFQDGQCIIPPDNDECASAIEIPVNPPLSCPGSLQTFTTQFATVSASPNMSCDATALNDVWLKFNTGNFGTIRINIAPGSATGLRAGVVDCDNSLVFTCWNPANGPYVVSGLNPSAFYSLRVWSPAGQSGTFTVCIEDVCDDASAAISGNAAICPGGSAQFQVDLTGTPPWNFTWSDGVTTQSVTTSVTPYFVTVTPTVSTNYTLTAFSTAICQGTVSGIASVAVLPPPTVTLAPFPNVCSNVVYTFVEGSPTGGVYSGPGVVGKTFNAPQLGPGTYAITYTAGTGSGCKQSATRNIVVIAAPSIISFAPTIAPIGTVVSIYGSNFAATSQVSFNGTFATTVSYVSSGQLNAVVPNGATTGSITVLNPNGCSFTSATMFGVGATPLVTSLNLKVFLQGFYTGGGFMNPVLDPVNSPAVCDSITVELRPALNSSQVSYIRKGLLNTNGSFTASYPNAVGNASYYIVVKHRSSVETWSKNAVYFPVGGIVHFDFTVATP